MTIDVTCVRCQISPHIPPYRAAQSLSPLPQHTEWCPPFHFPLHPPQCQNLAGHPQGWGPIVPASCAAFPDDQRC